MQDKLRTERPIWLKIAQASSATTWNHSARSWGEMCFLPRSCPLLGRLPPVISLERRKRVDRAQPLPGTHYQGTNVRASAKPRSAPAPSPLAVGAGTWKRGLGGSAAPQC